MKYSCLFLIILTLSSEGFADEKVEKKNPSSKEKTEHEETQDLPSGVISYHEQDREFSLKPKVVENFGILMVPSRFEDDLLIVPKEAMVRSLNLTSVYIFTQNRFKEIPVSIFKTNGEEIFLRTKPLPKDFSVVKSGAQFLKTIHLSLEEGPSEGH